MAGDEQAPPAPPEEGTSFVDRAPEGEPEPTPEERVYYGRAGKTLRVWTARLGEYQGRDALDVTRGEGDDFGKLFAPSWRILSPYLELRRDGKLTERHWLDYEVKFLEEMRWSWRNHREEWLRLLARREVTLLCFCTDWKHCHRRLLASRVFPGFGASDEGERPKATKQRTLW